PRPPHPAAPHPHAHGVRLQPALHRRRGARRARYVPAAARRRRAPEEHRMTDLSTRTDLYPSRVADRPSITDRVDPVVHGAGRGPLDPEMVAAYEDQGFLVLSGILGNHEVEALNDEVDRIAADER